MEQFVNLARRIEINSLTGSVHGIFQVDAIPGIQFL
jgi:hypothetical protein